MSAISLKSITGITSITTPAGVDNQLTLHNNNTTEAVKLDIAGNLHFHNHLNITGVSTASNFKTGTSNLHNTGLNVFDLDVDGHTELDNVNISGVTTATTIKSTSQLKLIAAAGNSVRIRTPNDDDNVAVFNIDDSTHLYYNSAHKFSTVSDGIRSVGNVTLFEKVIHEGDTDTFLQFTDNVINLAAGGTTGLSVQTTSVRVPTKLGINGAAPQTPLDVIANGSGYAMAIRGRSSDNTAELRFTSNDYGSLYGTIIGGPTYLKFATSGTNRWQMDSSGHLLPNTAGAVNIGSATAEIGDIFIADDKRLQLGSDQDMLVYHDNIHGYVSNRKANLYLSAPNYVQIISTDTNGSNQQTGARFLRGGKSEIFHSNSVKFETSSTGITVTGEVAASQDYPNQRPSLDLNFAATKKLDSRITYTRSGRASFINEHGLLEIVSSNVPRFDHDPVTRECKGLLIEAQRTNIITYSNAPGMSSPNLGGNPQVNDTVSNITLPTGEKGSVRRYLAASGGGGGRWGDYSGTNNQSYAGSVWVRTVSGTGTAIIDINDGGGKTINLTTEWQRVTTTHATNNTYRFFDIYFASPVTIYYWGVQIEEGGFMSSYIPTNNATATRGADSAVIDGQNFTDFYNPIESSVLAVGTMQRPVADQGQLNIFHIGDNNEDGHGVFREHGTKDVWYHIRNNNSTPSGGNLNPNGFGDWDAGEEAKIAIAFKDGDQAISVNGGNQITATVTSSYPTADITKMWIGSYGTGGYFEGTIKRITYYPKQLSDNQLNTITS